MSVSYNKESKIKYMIFGQSHSEAIGIVIEGLDAGYKPDLKSIESFMKRRAPGRNSLSTQRKEADTVKIISGLNEDGYLCGAPLCIIIENTNIKSKDYSDIKYCPRPGHSDYTAYIKYNGYNDIRGGGQFSGRLTAPLCAAGAIAKDILKEKGIHIGAHISKIHGISDESFDPVMQNPELFDILSEKDFPVISDEKGILMKEEIEKAKENSDSVGGIIECMITGLDAGIGSDKTESIESKISSIIFSVPSVKGIEFGAGFSVSDMFGSENNDEFYYDNDVVKTYTNNHGGILGGISSGMPITFKVAIKPTPSIFKKQRTVNLKTKENTVLSIDGRHDPCIVPRAVPVIEACAALSILDLI